MKKAILLSIITIIILSVGILILYFNNLSLFLPDYSYVCDGRLSEVERLLPNNKSEVSVNSFVLSTETEYIKIGKIFSNNQLNILAVLPDKSFSREQNYRNYIICIANESENQWNALLLEEFKINAMEKLDVKIEDYNFDDISDVSIRTTSNYYDPGYDLWLNLASEFRKIPNFNLMFQVKFRDNKTFTSNTVAAPAKGNYQFKVFEWQDNIAVEIQEIDQSVIYDQIAKKEFLHIEIYKFVNDEKILIKEFTSDKYVNPETIMGCPAYTVQ